MSYSPETQETLAMTATTIGRDILAALVQEIRLLPDVWTKVPQAKQDDIITRLRNRVDVNVKMAVHLIASNGRTVVAGDLEQITIKDGAKAVIKIGRGAESLHELYEAQGQQVLVVVSGAHEHTDGMDKIRGEADQRAMDLGQEYTDGDGDGMDQEPDDDDPNVIDVPMLPAPEDGEPEPFDDLYEDAARLVITEQNCGISFLQRHLRIGYNRASRLMELLERAGIVSTPDAMGARVVLVKPDDGKQGDPDEQD